MIEIRDENPAGPASRALWDEYRSLVRERLGPSFELTEAVFARSDDFVGPEAGWLVVYDEGEPVACGGVRPLDAEVAEIKRMFVTAAARGRGHAKRLLAELEERARASGRRRVRLLTTEVLSEARSLYAAVGYEVIDEVLVEGRRDFWLERELG